jgi:hypothetical protein
VDTLSEYLFLDRDEERIRLFAHAAFVQTIELDDPDGYDSQFQLFWTRFVQLLREGKV